MPKIKDVLPPLWTSGAMVNITMPIVESFGWSPVRVTCESPKPERQAVYLMAYYFKREFGYDVTQYGYQGDEEDPNHVAYLWHYEHTSPGWRVHCAGGACFRRRHQGMALQWVWLHPCRRRRGLLSEVWPRWVRDHGDFIVEFPLSDAMQSFLQKVGHTNIG